MNIFDIQGLIDNTATIYTKIEVLPKVTGESIITLTNEDAIKTWTYSDLRYVEKQGFIGQFVARTLDGELQDISDDFNIEDREIILYLGIQSNHTAGLITQNNNDIVTQANEEIITEQGAEELTYYKLGNFFVEKPDSDEVRDSTKFQSMDYTMLFNVSFNANYTDSVYTKSFNQKLADDENVTALWLAQYTCKQVGVELGSTTFRNSSFSITSNQFDSAYSCRDVIKAIAKLAFTWARIGWDNKLYLDFNKQTGTSEEYNIITNDNYYSLVTQKDIYGEVNRVLTGSSIVIGNNAYIENAESIENNGLTELDVYDNPILYTQELREQAIEAGRDLLGLMYQPIEIETTGHPWLLGNELVTVVDMEGTYLSTYLFDRVITYNGHIRTKMSSMTKTETESTYSYQGVENNDQEIKRSKVELDRQNQTLTSVMERTTTNESQISTMTQNINGISANITSMSGNITSLQGNVSSINGDISSLTNDLSTLSTNVSTLSSDLNGLSVEFSDFYDNEYIQTIEDLQNQIDGTIEFWTGNDVPTLNNAPANQWTTEADRQNHNGDVYTVISGSAQGASYRFIKDGNTWKWLEISDSQIGAVRELAQSAMNKANQNALDIVDLQATDVSLQAGLDGITASYSTLNTKVDELGEGYDAIATAERTAIGNPILIEDCGEYLIKNLTIYGNTVQDGIPTSTVPVEVRGITGEHTIDLSSNNLYHHENDSKKYDDFTIRIEDNVIILDGTTDDSSSEFSFSANLVMLLPDTYTISYEIEGSTTNQYIPTMYLRKRGGTRLLSFYHNVEPQSNTFIINETTECYISLYNQPNTTYEDYKIKIQIEKGTDATPFSPFVEPSSYTYNLGNLELYGIRNYKDYINYNITDEIWYYHKYITKKNIADIIQTSGVSDDNNIVFKTYDMNYASFGTTFPILNKELPVICTHFKWGGVATNDSDALSKGIGVYTGDMTINNKFSGMLYVVVPKSITTNTDIFKTWCENNGVYLWFVQEDFETEELTDNNLISDLDYIRNNVKLYNTHMIVEDTPNDTSISTVGDIGINYLTDTVFNGIYASRSELKITQNSISTTVSETVNAVVENIDNRVTDVANTLEQNSKDLSNSINVLNESLGEYAKQSSLVTVTNSVEEIQTALNEQILVTQKIQQDGVDKVTTTTGFTFDSAGLTIDKTGADTKTVIDEDGMTVYSTTGSEQAVLLNVDSQGVETENLHVRTYTQIGSHSRLQDYEDGTAIFYIE